MSDTVIVALVSSGASVITAVTALTLNYRLFNSLERRIEVIEGDLKQIFQLISELDKRISRLEEKR